MSIAQFIGKPLASGGTELRSRRTGIRYRIEPDAVKDFSVYRNDEHIGWELPRDYALTHIVATDLSISAG